MNSLNQASQTLQKSLQNAARKSTLAKLQTLPECAYRVSVKALIRDQQGNVLVVKEGDEYWDLPGGGTDHSEDLTVSMKREIREEIGLDVEVGDLYDSIKFVSVDGIHALFLIYECHAVDESALDSLKLRPEHEADEITWLKPEELTDWPLDRMKPL